MFGSQRVGQSFWCVRRGVKAWSPQPDELLPRLVRLPGVRQSVECVMKVSTRLRGSDLLASPSRLWLRRSDRLVGDHFSQSAYFWRCCVLFCRARSQTAHTYLLYASNTIPYLFAIIRKDFSSSVKRSHRQENDLRLLSSPLFSNSPFFGRYRRLGGCVRLLCYSHRFVSIAYVCTSVCDALSFLYRT